MKKIQFRAWHSARKEMLDVGSILGEGGSFYEDHALGEKDVVLMQYTGLKDQNGVEIYEGDILINPACDEDDRVPWVIEYCTTQYNAFFNFGILGAARSSEVIGNIYQNPELLEGGK